MSIRVILDDWAKLQAQAERNRLTVELRETSDNVEYIVIRRGLTETLRRPTTITGALHWMAGYEAGRAATGMAAEAAATAEARANRRLPPTKEGESA
jgi:outer membrane protein assembly factor BamA